MLAEPRTVRVALAIGLLAIIPAVLYGVQADISAGATAALNVVLIVLALLLLFGPAPSERAHSHS